VVAQGRHKTCPYIFILVAVPQAGFASFENNLNHVTASVSEAVSCPEEEIASALRPRNDIFILGRENLSQVWLTNQLLPHP
jgi:hypothetical protein